MKRLEDKLGIGRGKNTGLENYGHVLEKGGQGTGGEGTIRGLKEGAVSLQRHR